MRPVLTMVRQPAAKDSSTMAYEIGTRIRVEFSARVGRRPADLLATTKVSETDGINSHYLYLRSSLISGTKTEGETIRAEFDAEVTGEIEGGPSITTQVDELDARGKATGFRHYVYLGSKFVTELPKPEPKPEPKPYGIGDKIRVDFSARVKGSPRLTMSSATLVSEATKGSNHYIYLGSSSVTGDKELDGLVRVAFDAEIAGPAQGNDLATTKVVELDEDGNPDCTHYIYLGGTAGITRLEEPEPAVVTGTAASEAEALDVLASAGEARIKPSDTEIRSADVLKRIAELEGRAAVVRYRVIRNRNGEILNNSLSVLRTLAEAEKFLNERDFNRDRFTIEPVRAALSDDDRKELNQLLLLDRAGQDAFGALRWTAGVLLRADDYFTEAWGKDRAVRELDITDRNQLDAWPLSTIDWADAVQDVLDNEYTKVYFAGEAFWGSDTE